MKNELGDVVEHHVIIDIETLSTDSNAFITSIAAIEYKYFPNGRSTDDPEPQRVREYVIDPWVEQPGAVISPDTIRWRQQQSEESKRSLRLPAGGYLPLDYVLEKLRDFIGDAQVWANAPDFDLVILNNAAKRMGLKPITKFYNHRCIRTAKMALELSSGHPIYLKNPHTPLEDCQNQLDKVVKPHLDAIYGYRKARSGESEGGLGSNESSSGSHRGTEHAG